MAKTKAGDPAACFEAVVAAYARDRRVEPPAPGRAAFGSNGLRYEGRIFAMLVRGALVVKLPRERVSELVDSGRARSFTGGQGRVMREWVTIDARELDAWLSLASEARAFAAAPGASRPKRSRARPGRGGRGGRSGA